MNKNNNVHGHVHSGMSSAGFLNAAEILDAGGLKKGQIVLDIGSGTGYIALAAVSFVGSDGKVFAVDADEKAIAALNRVISGQNISNLTAICEDVTRHISVPEKSIDVCLMVNVLHGFVINKEVNDVFHALAPTLKEKAKLVVIDFKKDLTKPGPPQEIRLLPKDIEAMLHIWGFVSERVFEAGPFHFGQVLWKDNSSAL
ncbi:MAG: class I SAM-dependent methyltransferase [Candidatus Aminicenantes bacterium]|jgi:ubiquinone/menaquinone biosynthesis C-methylase UbiE